MAWSRRLFGRETASSLDGMDYRVNAKLYSQDGRREVEVREFRNGASYILERQMGENGTFEDRHSGRLVGPFASPDEAERFIVTTEWFNGRGS